jgi:hypothetical protein
VALGAGDQATHREAALSSYFVEFALGYTNSEQKLTTSQMDSSYLKMTDELPLTL